MSDKICFDNINSRYCWYCFLWYCRSKTLTGRSSIIKRFKYKGKEYIPFVQSSSVFIQILVIPSASKSCFICYFLFQLLNGFTNCYLSILFCLHSSHMCKNISVIWLSTMECQSNQLSKRRTNCLSSSISSIQLVTSYTVIIPKSHNYFYPRIKNSTLLSHPWHHNLHHLSLFLFLYTISETRRIGMAHDMQNMATM